MREGADAYPDGLRVLSRRAGWLRHRAPSARRRHWLATPAFHADDNSSGAVRWWRPCW